MTESTVQKVPVRPQPAEQWTSTGCGDGGGRWGDGGFGGSHDGVALFDEAEEVRSVGGGAKVRPRRVGELRDFADGGERVGGVREGEIADDDVGCIVFAAAVGGGTGGNTGLLEVCKRRTGEPTGGGAGGAGGVESYAAFGEGFEFKGPEFFVRPVAMAFRLTALGLSGKHDDDADILLPNYFPEIL